MRADQDFVGPGSPLSVPSAFVFPAALPSFYNRAMARFAATLWLAVAIPAASGLADVTGAGPSLYGPYHVRADGSFVVGRSVITPAGADRAVALAERSLELVARIPSAGPIRIVIEPDAPVDSARRLLAAFRPASILHEDSASLEGVVLRIASRAFVIEARMAAEPDAVTRSVVTVALEELALRRQAAATHYRALAAEGKPEDIRTYLAHYQEISRVYSQLYQLQRRSRR